MPKRLPFLAALAALAVPVVLALPGVRGEDEPFDPQAARKALEAAIERGRALYTEPWVEGGKACAECHTQGPNRMRAARLKAYPKYDFTLKRILSGQQKLNDMIVRQAKGEALALGSDDLNALEAYVSTLR